MLVDYIPGFIKEPDEAFSELWNELNWERRGLVPRREFYSNSVPVPYSYGKGRGIREYLPQPEHPRMKTIREQVEQFANCSFEATFINGYEDGSDHLGNHADDSPSLDNGRPIAIISLGAEREFWYCPQDNLKDVTKLKLQNGSLCLMPPGMQLTHFHRIPKASFICGPRVSLTFRGYGPT